MPEYSLGPEQVRDLDVEFSAHAAALFRATYGKSLDCSPIFPFDPEDRSDPLNMYDPNEPTIGIFDGSFTGEEFLGLAAAQARADGETAPNIIILFDWALRSMEIKNSRLYSCHGAIVDAAGKISVGAFSRPVRVDLLFADPLDTANKAILADAGVPMTIDPGYFEQMNDKFTAKALLHSSALMLKSIGVDHDQPASYDDIAKFIETHAPKGVVVKPRRAARGVGVKVFAESEVYDIVAHSKLLADDGVGAIIEPYKPPILIQDDNDRDKQWNIRGVGGGGHYFGAYARVAPEGGPVNYAMGATEHSLEWLLDKLEAQGLNPDDVAKRFEEAHAKIDHPSLYGSDMVITETSDGKAEVVAYEINYGPFGGLENIIEYKPIYSEKHASVKHILDYLVTQIPVPPDSAPDGHAVTRLSPTDSSQLKYEMLCAKHVTADDIERFFARVEACSDTEDTSNLWLYFGDLLDMFERESGEYHPYRQRQLEAIADVHNLEAFELAYIATNTYARESGLSLQTARDFVANYPNSTNGYKTLLKILLDEKRYGELVETVVKAYAYLEPNDAEAQVGNLMYEIIAKDPRAEVVEEVGMKYIDKTSDLIRIYNPVVNILGAMGSMDSRARSLIKGYAFQRVEAADFHAHKSIVELGTSWAIYYGEWRIANGFLGQYVAAFDSLPEAVTELLANPDTLPWHDTTFTDFAISVLTYQQNFGPLVEALTRVDHHSRAFKRYTKRTSKILGVDRKLFTSYIDHIRAKESELALNVITSTVVNKKHRPGRLDLLIAYAAHSLNLDEVVNLCAENFGDAVYWSKTYEDLGES